MLLLCAGTFFFIVKISHSSVSIDEMHKLDKYIDVTIDATAVIAAAAAAAVIATVCYHRRLPPFSLDYDSVNECRFHILLTDY